LIISKVKLLDEISRNFDGRDRGCCARNFTDMKYLDNCVKEVLRLYPSLPFFTRSISEEVRLGKFRVKVSPFERGRMDETLIESVQFSNCNLLKRSISSLLGLG
jgi:Cytochrome P450